MTGKTTAFATQSIKDKIGRCRNVSALNSLYMQLGVNYQNSTELLDAFKDRKAVINGAARPKSG